MMIDKYKWKLARQRGIGGSDAAAILGFSPWRSPMDVWMEKMGIEAKPDATKEFLLNLGQELEPVIARLYTRETKQQVYEPMIVPVIHKTHEILIGTPDRLVQGDLRGVELKSENQFQDEFGEPGTDQVPYHYLIQCAHYMAVMDYPVWDVALLKAGTSFSIYHIERDQELEKEMIDQLRAWWARHIVMRQPPDIDGSDAWAVYLKQKYPRDILPITEGNEAAPTLVNNLRMVRQVLKEYENIEAAYQNKLKEMIGVHEGIKGDFGRVTWRKSKDSEHTDWESLAKNLFARMNFDPSRRASIIQQFTTTRPGSRRFLLSIRKGWTINGPGTEGNTIAGPDSRALPSTGNSGIGPGSPSEGDDRSTVRDGDAPSTGPGRGSGEAA